MAISLADIKTSTLGPPRIVIYGVPGIGKTTLAAQAPNPIFVPIEDGLGMIEVPAFPQPTSFGGVIECMNVLLSEPHDFETVVFDSLDKLEPLIWAHVCAEGKKTSIEDFGYGKGYTHAASIWRDFLSGCDALRARGLAIILIAHSAVVKFEAPDTDAYDRYQLRLHKAADAAICDWADCVLFANSKVVTVTSGSQGSERRRGVSDGSRVIYTTERPAWRAKNRYRMPDALPLDWNAIQNAIAPATAPAPVSAPAS